MIKKYIKLIFILSCMISHSGIASTNLQLKTINFNATIECYPGGGGDYACAWAGPYPSGGSFQIPTTYTSDGQSYDVVGGNLTSISIQVSSQFASSPIPETWFYLNQNSSSSDTVISTLYIPANLNNSGSQLSYTINYPNVSLSAGDSYIFTTYADTTGVPWPYQPYSNYTLTANVILNIQPQQATAPTPTSVPALPWLAEALFSGCLALAYLWSVKKRIVVNNS